MNISPDTALIQKFPLPPLSFQKGDCAAVIRRYIEDQRKQLDIIIENGEPAIEAIAWRTAALDHLLITLYDNLGGNADYTIIAQGGYGRGELCYHSDVDVLFLHNQDSANEIKGQIETLLYPLWDSGLDLGYAVRNEKECLQLMKEDLTILTSLIDTRYLAGKKSYFNSLQKKIRGQFSNAKFREDFARKKEQEQKDRSRRLGGQVYLLEPNTKDGRGGLRDYHHIHWVNRTSLGSIKLNSLVEHNWLKPSEIKNLKAAVHFMWKVRNELHRRSGRKNDQILFDYQAPIAEFLGFKDSDKILAVEDFMRTYYRHAAECLRISQKVNRKSLEARRRSFRIPFLKSKKHYNDFFSIHNKFLSLRDPDVFKKHPNELLNVFRIIQEEELGLGRTVKESIREHLDLIDEDFQRNPENAQTFRAMLSEPSTFVPAMMAMHNSGVLERYLPEFGNLMYRVQHDIYHVYTVDTHSILAVGEFGKLIDGDYESLYPTPTHVAREIIKKDLLSFAILYHDIGKGEGSGHVLKGAPLIRKAAARLGFTDEEVDQMEFLELSHLLMTHLAFRRDLDDPNMILEFAKAMDTEENLNLLYVQTFCDVNAVSQEALTKWKESLLEYLYLKTRSVLTKGEFTKERVKEVSEKLKQDVTLLAGADFSSTDIEQFFTAMPPRYFLTASAVTILDHLNMWNKSKVTPFVFHHRNLDKEDQNEWTILTLSIPGLFPKLCGVLAANNISISEASLNRMSDGHDLHTFKVQNAQGQIITNHSKWQKIETEVKQVLQGEVSLNKLLGDRLARPSIFKEKTARRLPTKVAIDNDLSAFYTLIDVYAHDRVGLLYQITSALFELGLYVDVSKIATKVDQVTDTFYVRDIFGHKITSESRLKKVRERLMEVIDNPEGVEASKETGAA